MGAGCQLCTIVLSATKALIENKVEQEKAIDFITTQLCARLGALNATCVAYVKLEGENMLEMLEKRVVSVCVCVCFYHLSHISINDILLTMFCARQDPAVVCLGMGLCLNVQLDETGLANKFFDLNVRNIGNCTQCRQVVLSVRAMLSDKKSQTTIVEYINANLCALAGKSQDMCKTMVDAYAPVFFAMIVEDINDTQICTMIGMCDAKCLVEMEKKRSHVAPVSSIQLYHDESSKRGVNATCILCEFALNLLERVISENQTEEEVFKMFDFVCREMPKSLRNECETFVHAYGPLVAALVARDIEPSKVCSYIGLCPAATCAHMNEMDKKEEQRRAYEAAVHQSKNSETACVVCQFTVTYLLDETSFMQTERFVEYTIGNVCRLTPRKYRDRCDSLVLNYGSKLVELMEKYSEPGNICQLVDMCPSSAASDKSESIDMTVLQPSAPLEQRKTSNRPRLLGADDGNSQRVMNPSSHLESLECSLCIYVAGLADKMLKENKTEKQITAELELVCNLFPSQMKKEVIEMIDPQT